MALPALTVRDVTITAETGSGNTATMVGNDGNFELPDLSQGGKEAIDIRNRGDHVAYIPGPGREFETTLQFTIGSESDVTDGGNYRLYDMVNKTGLYASDDSIETIGCGLWAIKVTIAVSNACGKSFTATYAKVRPRMTLSMTEEGTRATVVLRSPNPPTLT